MKLVFLALLASQLYLGSPTQEPIKDYAGQYVLVHRYWGSCSKSDGDTFSTYECWEYRQDYFPDLDSAIEKLSDLCGPGYTCIDKDGFVGIYKLTPAITRNDAKFSEGDKEIPAHVEATKEHWSKWEIKKP